MPAKQDNGKLVDLPRLDECERFEQFVEGPEATREDDVRVGVLHEHRLADEEVAEVHRGVDVRIRSLFEWKLDIAADRATAAEFRALVGGFHDSRPGAGDDVVAGDGEEPRGFLRGLVHRIVGPRARRTEKRDALRHFGEHVEPLDELAHDAQHAPRIGLGEVQVPWFRLQQLRVFSERNSVADGRVDGPVCSAGAWRRTLRWWRASSRQMTFFRSLLQALERALLGIGPAPRIDAEL